MFKILVYHGIVKKLDDFDKFFQKNILIKDFKKQVKSFKKKHRILSLDEFTDKWQNRKLKDNELLIFFDDCYQSATKGAEILESFKIPAVFSVSSGLVNKGYSWTDDIEIVLTNSKKKIIKFNQSVFDTSNKQRRYNAILYFKKYFQTISTDAIERGLEELAQICEVNPRQTNQEKFRMISWEELRQINSVDFFKIIHHSHSHFPLSRFANEENLSQDIKKNTDILRKELQVKPYAFVYPFGRSDDYDERTEKILKDYGFRFAFVTGNKPVNHNNQFVIHRIMAN
jgi:peptidoglycan/xylan/chitin deacetylase (PgdA/CDA1 family)